MPEDVVPFLEYQLPIFPKPAPIFLLRLAVLQPFEV